MGVLSAQGPETVLETDRLLLRPWRVPEAVVQRELWAERDPRVPPHRRLDEAGRPTLHEMEAWIRDGARAPGLGLLAVERRGEGDVIGYCGLIDGAVGAHEPELAYELLRRAWGAGYATEAAEAVVGWARESGYGRLWSTVRDWNAASLRVLAKVGFVESEPRGAGRRPRRLAVPHAAPVTAASGLRTRRAPAACAAAARWRAGP